jgi:hypothetical protein
VHNTQVQYGTDLFNFSRILDIVPKIPDPGELRAYRSISVLPALSKALSRFIDGNRLLSPNQSGFCSGHSTAKALLKITNDIHMILTIYL